MSEYKMPVREQNSNKGSFGKLLNFAGSKNYIGAAYLSTISAFKIGTGFVALATEKEIMNSVASLVPEAVFLTREDGLKYIDEFNVCSIGCGLGRDIKAVTLFRKVISKLQKRAIPLIIDADGINILAKLRAEQDKDILALKKRAYHNDIEAPSYILTPHPLEAARLLSKSLGEVLSDLEGSAKEISEQYNCITVLKTHRTIIANKDGIYVNQNGNSALAKAGSGDVLTGIISGLLAQKMGLYEAAKLGVYLHSRAGEIASEDLTEYSVQASDLFKYLPKAIKEIL